MLANWFELAHEVHDRTSRALDVEERACAGPCGAPCESAAVKPVNSRAPGAYTSKLAPDPMKMYVADLIVLRIGLVSGAIHSCLLGPTGAYRGLLMSTMISVSIQLPISSVLSADHYLNRHYVPKSFVTSGCNRIISNPFTTNPVCCAQQIESCSSH